MRIFTLTVYLPDNDNNAIDDLDDCFDVLQEHLQTGLTSGLRQRQGFYTHCHFGSKPEERQGLK